MSTLIDETTADTRRIREMISGTDVTEEEYREILDEIQKVGYIDPIVMTPEEQKAFFRKAPRYMNA